MAHSTCILLQRSRLPSVSALAAAISASDYPMTIDLDWTWDTHEGWLPAVWGDDEASFEIFLETLDEEQTAELNRAGYTEMDTAVVVTMRGCDSLRGGAAFASVLTQLSEGCISEEEDVFLAYSDVADWARTIIDESNRFQKEETQREVATAAARAAGNIDEQFAAAMAAFCGQAVNLSATAGLLMLRTAENNRISSFCWKLNIGDRTYDHKEGHRLQVRQIQILNEAAELPGFELGNLPGTLGEEMAALLKRREILDDEEEQVEMQASRELEQLAQPVIVKNVSLPTTTTITVELDSDNPITLEFVGGHSAMMASLTVEPLTFELGETLEIN